jgi:hypothetical protein
VQRTIRLHKAQAEFRQSTATYRGFVGGVGSGKTWAGAYDLIRRARPGRTYLAASPTYTMLDDITYPTFRSMAQDLGVWLTERKTPRLSAVLVNGATIRFRSADNPDTMRGPNLSGVWLDEGSLMDRLAFQVAIGRLREGGDLGWLSCTFTPKGLGHWTYEMFGTNRPDTAIFHARTRDNPFNDVRFAQTLGRMYDGAFAQQELDGLFVEADDSCQVIPAAWVRIAMDRWTPDGHNDQLIEAVGVDVAYGGADTTCLAPRRGFWFAPLLVYQGRETPSGKTAAYFVRQALGNDTRALLCVDSIGYGAACVEALAEQGLAVLPVNFGAGTSARDRTGLFTFSNLRAFAMWSLREILDPSLGFGVALPPDRDLEIELTAARWSSVGGVVRIEPKADIKKRIGRSPDRADAVALSILTPGFGGGIGV